MRSRFLKSLFIVLVTVSAAVAADVPAMISGKVFFDTNKNGKLDAGERGVPNVPVTDSVEFVKTGPDGAYSITIADDPVMYRKETHVVSISWPSDTWPTGDWWARADRVGDGKNVNFGLGPDTQKRPFTFGHITDQHSGCGPYPTFGKQVKLMQPEMRLLVNSGDLFYTNYSDPAEKDPAKMPSKTYEAYVAGIHHLPLPLFHAIGNHDYCGTNGDFDRTHVDYGTGLYTRYLGPIRWSFNYGGAHFVGVDWARWTGPDYKTAKYEHGVPEVGARWLDKDLSQLAPGTPTFIFVHWPNGVPGFWQTAIKHKVTWMFGGHGHRYERLDNGGVTATTALNLRGQGACTIGVVSDEGYQTVHRCAGCKAAATYHCKYCALRHHPPKWFKLQKGKEHTLADKTVGNGAQPVVDSSTSWVSISAAVMPGSAEKFGLRLGEKKPYTVVCTKRGMVIKGAEIPYTIPPANDTPVSIEVYYADGWITVYALPGLRTTVAIPVDKPGKLSLFAEGGTATFKTLSLWEMNNPTPPKK